MSQEEIEDKAPTGKNLITCHTLSDHKKPKIKANNGFGWFISIGLHACFGFVLYMIVYAHIKEERNLPPFQTADTELILPREEKEPVILNVATTEDDIAAVINYLEVSSAENATSEDDAESQMNGREEAVANAEMGSTGAFMSLGPGGGAAGIFGNRNGAGKRRALAMGGGNRASENAVGAALRWFKRHQSPNGMWNLEKYQFNCTENPKCEPGKNYHGVDRCNIALTGYAVLCFLGAGYDHTTPTKYRTVVENGLNFLLRTQSDKGLLGRTNYEHAIATMALCEAYAMTNDPALKTPAQKSIDNLVKRQNMKKFGAEGYQRLGWDYESPSTRNDSSVTGWCLMALKSAQASGLHKGHYSMDGAKFWLERAWKALNPDSEKITNPETAVTQFPYTWDSKLDVIKEGNKGSQVAIGELCAVVLGYTTNDVILSSQINYIMQNHLVTSYPTNNYALYYNTMTLFQVGGEQWKKWNSTCRDVIVKAQRVGDGCFDGSWDPAGGFHGWETGRILSTAYCCLSLEVYYRYKPTGGK